MYKFFMGVGVGLILVTALQEATGTNPQSIHGEAIKRGYALYCPVDRRFSWVGECNKY